VCWMTWRAITAGPYHALVTPTAAPAPSTAEAAPATAPAAAVFLE